MKDDDFPLPEDGDVLFGRGEDDWNNLFFYLHSNDNLSTIAIGYKCAADVLVDQVNDENTEAGMCRDALLFPIAFLYRHYIELKIKSLIEDGNRHFGIDKKFPKTHRIEILWKECKPILKKIFQGKSEENIIRNVETVLSQMWSLDHNSIGFRYAEGFEIKSEIIKYEVINSRNMKDAMNKLANAFSGWENRIYAMSED